MNRLFTEYIDYIEEIASLESKSIALESHITHATPREGVFNGSAVDEFSDRLSNLWEMKYQISDLRMKLKDVKDSLERVLSVKPGIKFEVIRDRNVKYHVWLDVDKLDMTPAGSLVIPAISYHEIKYQKI